MGNILNINRFILSLCASLSLNLYAQPLEASIGTLDNNVGTVGGAAIYNREHLSQLSAFKDMSRGSLSISFNTSCGHCGGIHYLVRVFDENGRYLTHTKTKSLIQAAGVHEGRKPGRWKIEIPMNARDLRDADAIEFGFMPNLK